MRINEALGLAIKDIDFKNNIINVKQQKTRNNKITDILKTDAAYRQINFLQELYKNMDLTKEFLFENMSYTATRSYFRRLFEKLKVEFVLHSFKHTFISNCYYVGIPDKQIQIWAGHSKVETTINTYTHILSGNSIFLEYAEKLKKSLK